MHPFRWLLSVMSVEGGATWDPETDRESHQMLSRFEEIRPSTASSTRTAATAKTHGTPGMRPRPDASVACHWSLRGPRAACPPKCSQPAATSESLESLADLFFFFSGAVSIRYLTRVWAGIGAPGPHTPPSHQPTLEHRASSQRGQCCSLSAVAAPSPQWTETLMLCSLFSRCSRLPTSFPDA